MIYDKTAEQDRKVVEAVGAVATARRKRNGELLRLAEREFDVFLPVDRKLRHQQNLPTFSIAIIVMVARTNTLLDLRR